MGRKVLTAQLSDEAYRGWQEYADAHGLTMTAVVEAFGLILPAGIPKKLESEMLSIAVGVQSERKARRSPPSD